MEPEPWILQEMFLGGCRAITMLVLLGVQSGIVLMARVTPPSHCQWGCRRGTRQVSRGCPSCVATEVWGAPGNKLGRVMLEPEGCWRRLPAPPQCLLSFVGCKEIKGATSSPHEIISLLSLSPPPPMALPVCHSSGELQHNPVMVQQCQMVPSMVSVGFSDHLPPSQPLLRVKTLLMAIASSFFCRWWCSSPMTSCPKQ